MAKLYGMALCSRLMLWFMPYSEEAGAQEKRGCLEHIVVSFRLLRDMPPRKKVTWYVTFMDFSQAYDDKVPRRILFCALSAMYHLTKYDRDCSGNHYSECATGITYIIFIIYHVCKMGKDGCEIDGFLAWVHILVIMDDTVFLSTFRGDMIKKITLLRNYCKENGMNIS